MMKKENEGKSKPKINKLLLKKMMDKKNKALNENETIDKCN
jgi:hypothetical protein